MADAMEAAWQHVQEKAADELGRVERHGLEPVAAFDPVVQFQRRRSEGSAGYGLSVGRVLRDPGKLCGLADR